MGKLGVAVFLAFVTITTPVYANWGDCDPAARAMDQRIKMLFKDLKARGFNKDARNTVLSKLNHHYTFSVTRQIELIENRPGNQRLACEDYHNRLFDMYQRQIYDYFEIQ